MATVKVRADRAHEAAERLLADMTQPGRIDDRVPEAQAIVAACRLAMKQVFSDGTGMVTLTGQEPAWLLPYFQEPPEL